MRTIRGLSVLLPLALAAACSDSNGLGDATEVNVVDTVTLGALEGTPISTPSGYRHQHGPGADRPDRGLRVRLQRPPARRRLLPAGLPAPRRARADLDQSGRSRPAAPRGELRRHQPAPRATATCPIPPSRSSWASDTWSARAWSAAIGVPLYGKLEILSFQDSTVTFQVLADQNCGFKDLLPGLPDN